LKTVSLLLVYFFKYDLKRLKVVDIEDTIQNLDIPKQEKRKSVTI